MRKTFLVAVTFVLAMSANVQAQRTPVGIASVQDSVGSVQFGLISSTAIQFHLRLFYAPGIIAAAFVCGVVVA